MAELEKLFCTFADNKRLVIVMRSPLIFDIFFGEQQRFALSGWNKHELFAEPDFYFYTNNLTNHITIIFRTVLWLDETLVKNSVTLTFCQTVIKTIVRMLEVPGFKISFLGLKFIFESAMFFLFQLEL